MLKINIMEFIYTYIVCVCVYNVILISLKKWIGNVVIRKVLCVWEPVDSLEFAYLLLPIENGSNILYFKNNWVQK